MSYRYKLYGVSIDCNRSLDYLVPHAGDCQLKIRLPVDDLHQDGKLSEISLACETQQKGTHLQADFAYRWRNVRGQSTTCNYQFLPNKLQVSWINCALELARGPLYGNVFSACLRLMGRLAIHASAVLVGTQAVVIAGHSGAGKSSLTTAFVAAGHPMLSDDVAAIFPRDDGLYVHPGYPALRLWPDAIPQRLGTKFPTVPIHRWTQKRYLHLADASDSPAPEFCASPKPLAAIFLLQPRSDRLNEPAIKKLTSAEAAARLYYQRGASQHHLGPVIGRREFEQLSALCESVPVFSLTNPDDPARLPEVVSAILSRISDRSRVNPPALQRC